MVVTWVTNVTDEMVVTAVTDNSVATVDHTVVGCDNLDGCDSLVGCDR